MSPALGLRGCHRPEKPLLCWGCELGKGAGLRELLSRLQGTGQGSVGCPPMGSLMLGWGTGLLPWHESFTLLKEHKTKQSKYHQIPVGSLDGWGGQKDNTTKFLLDPRMAGVGRRTLPGRRFCRLTPGCFAFPDNQGVNPMPKNSCQFAGFSLKRIPPQLLCQRHIKATFRSALFF